MPIRSRLLAALVALPAFILPSAAHAVSGPPDFRPFAPDSVWNLPLRDDAPLDPNSDDYIADFLTNEMATGNRWIASTHCGMPLYWATAETPRVAVKLDSSQYQDPALKRAWANVPIPDDAVPAECEDENFAVFQRQPDGSVDTWEFWKIRKATDGTWTAFWGGATRDVERDSGTASSLSWVDPAATSSTNALRSSWAWNVTAAGFSQSAGVITTSELQAGRIDHAVAFAIGNPATSARWPAQRWDGRSSRTWALPEGTRLRLDPSLDLSQITMTPMVRMIAVAAQRYGIIVRDRTGADEVFNVEDPQPDRPSPLEALLKGKYPSEALAVFPWASLQILAAPTCHSHGNCAATPSARIDVDGETAVGRTVTLDTSNSVLNHPRKDVAWDLEGDGTFESSGGTAVKREVVLTHPGPQAVAVRITDMAGTVVIGHVDLQVASPIPTSTATPAAASAPVVSSGSPFKVRLKVASRHAVRTGRRVRIRVRVVGRAPAGSRVTIALRRTGGWRSLRKVMVRGRSRLTIVLPSARKPGVRRLRLQVLGRDGQPLSASVATVIRAR
jgi:hypothetical protein